MIADRFIPVEAVTPGKPVKCRDQQTAQTVILQPVRDLDPRLVGIFHPSLLTIFALVEDEGQTRAACEFVQGRTLESVFGVDRCHPRRAVEIVCEIADGVAELHGRGIAHGAISSASVLLTTKGKARLALWMATGGSPQDDLNALRALLIRLGGQMSPYAAQTDSAAVLAADLRG